MMTDDDIRRRRLISAAYLLAKRRAEAKAAQDLEAVTEKFEQINSETIAAIDELRHDLAEAHLVAAAERERADENVTVH